MDELTGPSTYALAVGILAVFTLGWLRFATHPRFRPRRRLPDTPAVRRARALVHGGLAGAFAGLTLTVAGAALGWPASVRWVSTGGAALGWLVAGIGIPALVRGGMVGRRSGRSRT